MDRFLNINWNPVLEDMIDSTFINGGRLERESVMHRIMTGNFTDPYQNIEEDYKDIKMDLMRDNECDITEEDKNENDEDDNDDISKVNKECQSRNVRKAKCYVPGIVKSIFKFPKISKLSKEQQAMCLRVLLRFSESDKPKLTQTEKEELKSYMDLQQTISQEQEAFLEFAKSKWHERSFNITCEDYINLCWQSKLQYIHKLPRYYAEVTNVPFIADKNIEMKFISVCLQMGELSKIVLPTLTRPYMLHVNSEQLQKRFPPKRNIPNESPISCKLPVSEDSNCQKLAESNNVDLVISSSGLNCLVNNIGPSYSNSWILPLVIKRHNDKNVIYIDKPAPPTEGSILEKNSWVYKYIIKYFLIGTKHLASTSIEGNQDNIFDDVNSEELLKLEEEHENTLTQTRSGSNMVEKRRDINETSKQEDFKNMLNYEQYSHITSDYNVFNPTASGQGIVNKNSEMAENNVSYKLFTIGPQFSEQNELMKNVIKEYRLLIRTKTDGFEILPNNVQRLLLLAPKLEYQVDLGAEVVTLEESLKQWISLICRPHTFLARVRISAKTSEILQIEQRTAISINNEIKRLYNMKVEDSLTILHNVVQSLKNLSPGRYIMKHTVKNGAFATIYKEVESPGKNSFDMYAIYGERFHNLLNPSWIPLDKTIPTPMLKCFERMPAMFHPSNNKTFSKNKKCLITKKSNMGTVRRSLRNKKKK
ncbi:Little elongation complex subunit 2 [Anthophora retusa]